MDAGPLRDVLTVIAGIGTGILSAAFGVGGAVVSTPAIRALGTGAALAVGTTLPSILPSALTGTLRYARTGLIDRRIVLATAPVGVVGAAAGSALSGFVPGDGHVLMLLTAALLAFTAWRMGRSGDRPQDDEAAEADRAAGIGAAETEGALVDQRAGHSTSNVGFALIGAMSGLMSGLLGVGGGIVMVPAFTEIAGMNVKRAIATSLACVGVFALAGTIAHAIRGGIDWRVALLLAVGVVPGAWLGAALAIRTTDHRLRVVVASFLGVIAAVYAGGELIALT